MQQLLVRTTPTAPPRVILENGPLRVEAATTLEALFPYADDWNQLALASPQRLPMISHAWVASYLEHLIEPGTEWACLFAFDHDTLIGVLPCQSCSGKLSGLAPIHLNAPASAHTRSVDFVLRAGQEGPATGLLLHALAALVPHWGRLDFTLIPIGSPTIDLANAGLPDATATVEQQWYGAYIPITGTYQGYLGSLSEKFSRNLRRLGNKIQQLDSCRERFVAPGATEPEHLAQFLEVEASGWKAAEGSAIRQSPQLVSFYRALTARFADLGWLEYHFVEAEGKTIAGHLGVRLGRSLVLLKIGYDEAYSSYAPGNVLMAHTIERAFSCGDTDEINCLTDMPWNRNWNMQKRPYHNITLHRASLVPLLTGYLPARARHLAAHVPGLPGLVRRLRRRNHNGD